jgi:hypothetical protein
MQSLLLLPVDLAFTLHYWPRKFESSLMNHQRAVVLWRDTVGTCCRVAVGKLENNLMECGNSKINADFNSTQLHHFLLFCSFALLLSDTFNTLSDSLNRKPKNSNASKASRSLCLLTKRSCYLCNLRFILDARPPAFRHANPPGQFDPRRPDSIYQLHLSCYFQ